jgi:putative glycosyltransferase (TIGR04348 family)
MNKPRLCIVSPAFADANNGNWQTAQRWAHMLSGQYQTHISAAWPDGQDADVLLALHARRSATSIAAWAQAHPTRPLVLALTGTDLYHDIHHDADAQHSLDLAHQLIVLQDQGLAELPQDLRSKAHVIFQSSTPLPSVDKTTAHLRVLMVGHLRDEKCPHVLWQVAQALSTEDNIYIDHIGKALDPDLGTQAQRVADQYPHYRWLGEQPHMHTRRSIQRAHVLVHPSRLEGGAHVIMEAILSGTPVLASRVSGNVGMLGADYSGYFEVGNASQLVDLLRQCRYTQTQPDGLLTLLTQACHKRAPLFQAEREQASLCALLGKKHHGTHCLTTQAQ